MPKNPHAVALGRKGGKAKGKPKGFAAMPAAEAKRIRALALKARRAGLKPDAPAEVVDAVVTLKKLTGIDLPAEVRRGMTAKVRKGDITFAVDEFTPEPSLSKPFILTVKAHKIEGQ